MWNRIGWKTIVEQFPNLVGVDISSNMVEETRKKEIYSNLFVSDIHEFLLKNQQKFDLVIAADVFIYIGKLQEIFKNLKNSLSDKAYFIFTIELFNNIENINYQLSKSGRYFHSVDYIESLCFEFGFKVINKEEITLRQEDKIAQKGVIFILQSKIN